MLLGVSERNAPGTSLSHAPTGQAVAVVAVGGEGALVRRLAELGIRAGATVTALHRTAGGGRVIEVAGSRIAVARTVLRAIETRGIAPSIEVGAAPDVADESGMPT